MTLVPSAPRSADAPLLSNVPFTVGTLRTSNPMVDPAEPVTPAFLVSLAALVAQVEQGPDPVRPALELSRLTVTRMAEELGIPRATLAAYRLGTRRMPASNRARLGQYLAAHADALARVARALCGEDRAHAYSASMPHASMVGEPGEAGTAT
jgi:hypothetical protein